MMFLFLSLLCLAAASTSPQFEQDKLFELLAKDKHVVLLSEVIITKTGTEINVCHDGTKKIEKAHLITRMEADDLKVTFSLLNYGEADGGEMSLEGKQCYKFNIEKGIDDDSWKNSNETEFILHGGDDLETIENKIEANNGTLVFGYGKAGKYVPIAGFEYVKCPVADSVLMTFTSPQGEFANQCDEAKTKCLFSKTDMQFLKQEIAAEYFDKDANSQTLTNPIACFKNNKTAADGNSALLENMMFFCEEINPVKSSEGDAIDLDSLDYKLKQFTVKKAMSANSKVFMFKGSEGETFLESINVGSGSNKFTITSFEKSSDIYTACPLNGKKGHSLQDLEVTPYVFEVGNKDITSFSFVNKYYDASEPEKTLKYTATSGEISETIDCHKIKSNTGTCYGFMDGAKKKFTIENKSGNKISNIVVTVP